MLGYLGLGMPPLSFAHAYEGTVTLGPVASYDNKAR